MAVSGCLALHVTLSVAQNTEALQSTAAVLLLLAALQSVAVSSDRPSVPPSPISTPVFGLSNNLTLYWVLFGLKQPHTQLYSLVSSIFNYTLCTMIFLELLSL